MFWAMLQIQQLVGSAAVVALVIARIAGFMVISPFPGAWVPQRARVALVLSLGMTIGVGLPLPDHPLEIGLTLVPLVVSDMIVGLFVGASFRAFLSTADLMAGLVSQSSWLAAPMALNPDMGEQSQVLTQISSLLAMLIVLGTGVHRVVLLYLLETFHTLPVGTIVNWAAGTMPLIELVGRTFEVGMQLAIPVLAVSLAVQTALALLSRVAPTLQIFSVGFAVLVASGLLTFMASIPAIAVGLTQFFQGLGPFLDHLLLRLAGG